jgi:ribonuclease HII
MSILVDNLLLQGDGILMGGVDEAGRGSIVGPLVVAGIGIRESKIALLYKMGIKDSKALNPKARARLFGEIMKVVDSVCIHKIDPVEVDGSVSLRGLNRLEAKVMASVINTIGADEAYVDCCDVNPQRYREYMECHLTCKTKLHSMHHADAINMVVSAASIIAKIIRDEEIQHIRSKYGSIGSGYPSDERTMRFIRDWVAKNGSAPEFTRKSWKPLRLILDQMTHCEL